MSSERTGKRWRAGDFELFTSGYEMSVKEFLHYDIADDPAIKIAVARWVDRPEYRATLLDVLERYEAADDHE